jgi:alkaline phosphatase D
MAAMTDGPLVGAVDAVSAKVFIRTDRKAPVAIEYSTSPALSDSSMTPSFKTVKANDFTAIVPILGLLPETTYYYRVLVGGEAQQRGIFPSFRTFAATGTAREFEFAVFGDLLDARQQPAVGAPAYETAAQDFPEFVMQIGDFDHRSPAKIKKMRAMHREVRGPLTAAGADFQQHIASAFPLFHVWDDHDYGANNGDKTFRHKADALKAFREYYPLPDLPNPAGIWHSFSYAQADFLMLDLRSQRDPVKEGNSPKKSMLDGDNITNGQKDWLKGKLASSTATWKFVISSVPFNPTVEKKDGWSEYSDERNELLNFIQTLGITGVIFISADMHFGGAIDDGTNSGLPEMQIPHTNLDAGHSDTTSRPGDWSEGIFTGDNQPGYGLVHVAADHVTLEVKGSDGSVRSSLVIGLDAIGAVAETREQIVSQARSGEAVARLVHGCPAHA